MDIAALSAPAVPSQTSTAFSQLTNNFDTFLTLLTTQLRNQDPLEPLDTEQFTQQLVQFAGVEQSIQTNSNLETLINLQTASQREQSLDLVGRVVSIQSDAVTFGDNQSPGPVHWQFSVPANTRSLGLEVIDSAGSVVATLEGSAQAGIQNIRWDGQGSNNRPVDPGTYQLRVIATLTDGATQPISIQTRDRINSVQFTDGSPSILVGGQFIDPSLITRVDTDF